MCIPHIIQKIPWEFGCLIILIYYHPDDEGSKDILNVGKLQLDYNDLSGFQPG